MSFQIDSKKQKKQSTNRTIRLPNELFEKLNVLAKKNSISFNRLIVQCIEYALDNIQD